MPFSAAVVIFNSVSTLNSFVSKESVMENQHLHMVSMKADKKVGSRQPERYMPSVSFR